MLYEFLLCRHFTDMMANEVQREFFRKVLVMNEADDPFNFVQDVQVLSKMYDPKAKATKLALIKHKYFRDPDHGDVTL